MQCLVPTWILPSLSRARLPASYRPASDDTTTCCSQIYLLVRLGLSSLLFSSQEICFLHIT